MKDRIKFNDAMLSAVMDGSKTQTRRPVDPQPVNSRVGMVNAAYCGKPNLWLVDGDVSAYTANGLISTHWICPYGVVGDVINFADKYGDIKGKIEIITVVAHPINTISNEGVIAEGFGVFTCSPTHNPNTWFGEINEAHEDFAIAWDGIYGKDSWENNEWVWAIEFNKVE